MQGQYLHSAEILVRITDYISIDSMHFHLTMSVHCVWHITNYLDWRKYTWKWMFITMLRASIENTAIARTGGAFEISARKNVSDKKTMLRRVHLVDSLIDRFHHVGQLYLALIYIWIERRNSKLTIKLRMLKRNVIQWEMSFSQHLRAVFKAIHHIN